MTKTNKYNDGVTVPKTRYSSQQIKIRLCFCFSNDMSGTYENGIEEVKIQNLKLSSKTTDVQKTFHVLII